MRQIQVFQARKLNDGENLTAANKAAADLHFKVVVNADPRRGEAPICKEQFYVTRHLSTHSRLEWFLTVTGSYWSQLLHFFRHHRPTSFCQSTVNQN